MGRVLYISLVILTYTVHVFGQDVWEEPFYLDPGNIDGVTIHGDIVYMDEELEPNIRAVIFNYGGNDEPRIDRYLFPPNAETHLGAKIERVPDGENAGKWCILIQNRQDYEASYHVVTKNYLMFIHIGNIEQQLNIQLINMDDNRPTLEALVPNCEIEEGDDVVIENLQCLYRIHDLDGHMNNITQTIEHEAHDDINDIFQFSPVALPTDTGITVMDMSLTPRAALDFEKTSIYVLSWMVTDTSCNYTELKVVVQVKDLPDTPPRWTAIFASQQFDEKEAQQFNITATDGDIMIDDKIKYDIDFHDMDWADLISINSSTGQIDVKPIDRDTLKYDTYSFTAIACEENEPKYCIEQIITFLVNDVNDNGPKIEVDGSTELKLDENTISTISRTITITDLDLGENAQYSIELNTPLLADDIIMYHESFSVAPNSGYQETNVYLFITNAERLDYEDENWRNFMFELTATGIQNTTHTDSVTFHVILNNLNDEIPIFETCISNMPSDPEECVIEIEETFDGLTDLVIMKANDRDEGDWATHRLLGSYANRILSIDETTGQITTANLTRPFDYETLSEIIIQVQAIDNMISADGARHTAISQLTIILTDVNDETPVIIVESSLPQIKENSLPGTVIENLSIRATDEDTDADLVFSIDWDKSLGLKNGANIGTSFDDYIGCVTIDTDDKGGDITAKLKIEVTVPENTPDYEKFDTLHLNVVVEDKNQKVNDGSTSVTIPILIIDVNDNPPQFDDNTIISTKSVSENAAAGTMIGILTATDADAESVLEFSLRPADETEEGLVYIEKDTGRIMVDGTKNIDADDPPLYALNYTVTVSDQKFYDEKEITIIVLDMNDNAPEFLPNRDPLPVVEKSPNATLIYTFRAYDADRDEANSAVVYYFRDSVNNIKYRSFFNIDPNTGELIVSYETDQVLDRDNSIPDIDITMEIVATNTDQVAQSGYTEVFIELIDINDNAPVLLTTESTAVENMAKGEIIDTIHATDADDPKSPNSHVHFDIRNIEAIDRTFDESLDDLFILTDINNAESTATLQAGKDLKDYYGQFNLTIQMRDFGDPILESEQILVVTINKYNFEEPVFIFPDPTDTMIYLARTQFPNTILQLFGDREELPPFSASDNQGGKFTFTFTIEGNDLFRLAGPRESILQITRELTETDLNTVISLKIKANSEGVPNYEAVVDVGIVFVDDTADPVFNVDTIIWNNIFFEEKPNQYAQFPEAKYPLTELDLPFLPVHYIVQDSSLPFTIPDSGKNILHLVDPLDREEQCCYDIIVQSSKSSMPSIPSEGTLLSIHIELIDVNNKPPVFEEDEHYAIFHSDDDIGNTVYTMTAMDPDKDSVVEYSISSVNDGNAQSFPKFEIDKDTGAVLLKSKPTSAATGYAILTVKAFDSVFAAEAELKIFVISKVDHIVKFLFQNTKVQCENQQLEIGSILTDFFVKEHYQATAKSCLDVVDDDNNPIADQVVAEVYFIDTQDNVPVASADIEKFASDIPTFQRLAKEFILVDLNLISFSSTPEEEVDTAEVLRAWLIGVSVVLGALCILLLVAFIVKTRSLTNRLNKLSVTKYGSQESGLNRKAVPNTNRHAVQGSNPVFNTEKTVQEFDQTSIGSGDSDLVGVEDNPEFDYTPSKSNGVANSA